MPWTKETIETLFDSDENFFKIYCSDFLRAQLSDQNLRAETRRVLRRLAELMPNSAHRTPAWAPRRPLAVVGPLNGLAGRIGHDNGKRAVLRLDTSLGNEGKILIAFQVRAANDKLFPDCGSEKWPLLNQQEDPENQSAVFPRPLNIEDGNLKLDHPLHNSHPFARALEAIDKQRGNDHQKEFQKIFFDKHAKDWFDGLKDAKPVFPGLFPERNREQTISAHDTDRTPTQLHKASPMQLCTLLYGPPGTGKTFATTGLALSLLQKDSESGGDPTLTAYCSAVLQETNPPPLSSDTWKKWIKRFEDFQRNGQIEFTTFHQNYSYEDFIEGIRAKTVPGKNEVSYSTEPGIFKRITYRALYAWLTGKVTPASTEADKYSKTVLDWLKSEKYEGSADRTDDNAPPYVLIIDEINRGNIARIMGELITLIEDSKRARHQLTNLGQQPLRAVLPVTGEPFIVPPNLYIIGTMNTADRSLVGLDLAFRRRFSFVNLAPRPEALALTIDSQSDTPIKLKLLLAKINSLIETQLDSDHLVGHAYLSSVTNMSELEAAMGQKILPLLIEYFHDAPNRLYAILPKSGDNPYFIEFSGKASDQRIRGIRRGDLKNSQAYIAWIEM